jgi:hypothetical protein
MFAGRHVDGHSRDPDHGTYEGTGLEPSFPQGSEGIQQLLRCPCTCPSAAGTIHSSAQSRRVCEIAWHRSPSTDQNEGAFSEM